MKISTLARLGLSAATLSLALTGCPAEGDDDDSVTGDDTIECADDVCVVSGTITDDLTLTSDVSWLLRGGVFIGDDVDTTVLTIEAGTTIYGESSTDGMLVVRRNSQIVAEGTADAPIVFTSSKSPGSRARGDWGGLILNGNAPLNSCGGDFEGDVCEAFGEGGTGWYGGDDPSDDSGVLRYVRVEFAGTLVSPENELNGIAFQGVGNGTELDFIQVHMNADDGIEFFGGTAEIKHVVLTGIGDDNIDWTDGWSGKLQFAVAQQYEDNGDNGIEADNNGDNNGATPRSNPTLSNVTLIGQPASSSSDSAMLLREGTAGDLSNIVMVGFNDACLDIDHAETFAQLDAGDLTVTHSLIDCAVPFAMDDESDGNDVPLVDPTDVQDWFEGAAGNTVGAADLADPHNVSAPGWLPEGGSAALSGGSVPAGSFFEDVAYRGAFGDTDWTAGWITTEAN